MKVFVEKTSSNFKKEKMTKTSKFLRFLIKFCILPIKISKNKVLFEFLSTKMLIHVLGIFVLSSCTCYGLVLFPTQFLLLWQTFVNLQSSWVEQISLLLSAINALVIIVLPSALSHSLKNMDYDFLQNQNFKWPKTARLNIAGMNKIKLKDKFFVANSNAHKTQQLKVFVIRIFSFCCR